jgi:8-oxo-dGTP diphosphatase
MGSKEQGISASKGRWHVVPRTLCFVTNGDDVLLLRGAPDKRIWPGKYNGVGGHIERGEDILQAARREILEETGLNVDAARLRGVVNIDTNDAQTGIALFIFTANATQRETIPSPEGDLEWHPRGKLPQEDLVDDLEVILPRVLAMGNDAPPFFAHYWYDDDDSLHIDFADV